MMIKRQCEDIVEIIYIGKTLFLLKRVKNLQSDTLVLETISVHLANYMSTDNLHTQLSINF